LKRAVLLLLLLGAASCARDAGIFSEQNARAHVSMLAGTIGPRPVGSEANARARAYIVDQLTLYGYDVRVQEVDARRPEIGRTAHVNNIIAVLAGRRSEAIGFVSHYDSRPESPGAGDDGLGVAVSLEAARVLAARTDRQWSIFVLVTDGEEADLMGAAGLLTDREVTSRLQAYINVESIGSRGTAMLFQTGPANGWITVPWARRAPHPRGASFMIEIYKRLPRDTDFTILARQGIPGLNFATIGDSYPYHSPRDTVERLDPAALRTTGENVVATATALDAIDITGRGNRDAVFFDIGGITAVSYSATIGWVVAIASMLLGSAAWLRATAAALRLGGGLRWAFTAFWSALGATVSAAAMVGAAWALRASREVYHPWYAHPDRLFLLLVAVGATAAWAMSRAGAWLPSRLHGLRHPIVTWSLALPLWLVMAAAMVWLAPGAAFMWTLPLLAASASLLLAPPGNPIAVRIASIVALAVSASLWLHNAVDLLRFVVTIFGWLPVITPVYVYPAVMVVAGVMIVPPLVAAVATPRPLSRPSLLTVALLVSIAVTGGFAYAAPAYTFDQPLRRQVRALQEAGSANATWEVGSVEPGLDLAPDAPGGWTRESSTAPASVPWGRLPQPFVFRTTAPGLGPAPIDVAGFTVTPVSAGVDVTATVVPTRAGLAVSFVLPAGITPARSSIPGALRLGQWTATFVAPPPEGIAWRASFSGVDPARLREIRLVVTESGRNLPAWLPQDRAVWNAAFTWVVPAAALAPVAPIAPLR
jgi:Peptidase family M28